MFDGGESILQSLMEKDPPIKDYLTWKKRRKTIASIYGSNLLNYSERELLAEFPKIQSILNHLLLQSQIPEQELLGLLYFSILHLFNKNYERINFFSPSITNLMSSTNRDVCRAACCSLRYLAKESQDNTSFLKGALQVATKFFSKEYEGKFIFNSLTILKAVGKFLPEDLFSVTCLHGLEIWNACCSNDSDLRSIAVKVYSLHLQIQPINREEFSKSCLLDCIEKLKSNEVDSYDGMIMLCVKLYKIFPKIFDVSRMTQLRDILLHLASIPKESLLQQVYDIVILFIPDFPSVYKPKANEFLLILISQLMGGIGVPLLLPKVSSLIIVFHRLKLKTLMAQSVLDLVSCISPLSKYKKYSNDIFSVLLTVMKLYPSLQPPASLFLKAKPCEQYLQVINLRPCYLKELKCFLIEQFGKGIQTRSSIEQQIVSIIIVRLFDEIVAQLGSSVFYLLLPFCESPNRLVRMRMVKTLSRFKTVEATSELMKMAVFDEYGKIRALALKQINPELHVQNIESITQLLVDPYFEVRKIAIPVIANAANYSVLIRPIVIVFMNRFFAVDIALNDPSKSANACSLLPLISKHFVQFSTTLIPMIAWICLKFLLHGDPIPEIKPGQVIGVWKQIDINECSHHDLIADNFDSLSSISERDVNKKRVYQIENEKHLEKRDVYLFETLGIISKGLMEFITQIIPVFIKTFREKHIKEVYIAATKALIKIVRASESCFNFAVVFPDLLPALLRLLCEENNQELAIEILKLTGTIGSSNSNIDIYGNSVTHLFAIKNPSFITSFVMDVILKLIDKESLTSLYKTITIIFVNHTKFAIPFLEPVLTYFIRAIEGDSQNIELWNYLEVICYYSESRIYPHLDVLKGTLVRYISSLTCIRLCIVLSYHLKVQFVDAATTLYPLVLHQLDSADINIVQCSLQFITFAILYQHQCPDFFIEACEKYISTIAPEKGLFVAKILDSLSFLLQLKPMHQYSARIARIVMKISRNLQNYGADIEPIIDIANDGDPRKLESVLQLTYNLCVHGYVDALSLDPQNELTKKIKQAVDSNQFDYDRLLPFIYKWKPELSLSHLNEITPTSPSLSMEPISDSLKWQFNSRQWIDNLCYFVVDNSPFIPIRCCSSVVKQSHAFKQELFPVAFMAWWKAASDNDRKAITNIISTIFEFDTVDPKIIDLLMLVDRVGDPVGIPDSEIAKKSSSTAMSVYLYQRYLKKNPNDTKALTNFLELNSRMGRLNSARGLLSTMSYKLDQMHIGKWSAKLGEWEKALEIYESLKPVKTVALIECYAKLELWDKIRESEPEFSKLDEKDKQSTALWYAWAFYHVKQFKVVEFYLKNFPEKKDLNMIFFASLYLIAIKRYNEANEMIKHGFEFLTSNLSIFNGSDTQEASRRMTFAQHLIELLEVLEIKKMNIVDTPLNWLNRLKNFSHEAESWMKLIEIGSLVLSIENNTESYLKILSVLRKERKWKLVEVYFNRFFAKTTSSAIILEHLKILWSKGMKKKAIELISTLNLISVSNNDSDALNIILSLPKKETFYEFFDIQTDNEQVIISDIVNKFRSSDNKMKARYLRIQANWQYDLFSSKPSSVDSLRKISQTYQQSMRYIGDDYRTFSGWAYANSRSLSQCTDSRANIALSAIYGFLKATQLRQSESLEFLCQMFSIYFRFGEEFTLPEEIRKEINELPAGVLHQIVPQIVVHISHKDPKISRVVQSIISEFGAAHFQALVYSLNVLSLLTEDSHCLMHYSVPNNIYQFSRSKRKNKSVINKAQIAKDMMDKLGSLNQKIYADSKLFIDGMHRSAITLYEAFLATLDKASTAQQMNDKELVISLIQNGFNLVDNPQCEMDLNFQANFRANLQRCRKNLELYTKSDDASIQRYMWNDFRDLYAEINKKIKTMETFQLSKVSEQLANMRHFDLSVPGTYSVDHEFPQLDCIDPILKILSSQQHPRSVFMRDTNGTAYQFLLKGNEDLRLDQRIMQFFNLINSLLKNNRNTADLKVEIIDYPIIPFAPNAGLITWVTGADTFQQLVNDYRSYKDLPFHIELDIAQDNSGGVFNSLTALQRYEMYTNVAERTEAIELREMLWLRSPDASTWLQREYVFTISTALMSMAGYTIGLGDRHPSNIMIQRHTGRCLHIDFGDSFEVAMNRSAFPERVPFRLTRMMINALDSSCYNGLFRKVCEDALWIFRESQSSIFALMEVFIHEPIFNEKEIQPTSSSSKSQIGILERVAAKLSGNDPAPYDNTDIVYEVDQQVDVLIKKAADPFEYVRHYVGWCPFW